MNKYHQQILEEIEKRKPISENRHFDVPKYLGTNHIFYNLDNPTKRNLAKKFAKENRDIPLKKWRELLDALYKGKSYEEKTIASFLLEYLPQQRKELDPKELDKWLEELAGWAEIDTLCSGPFGERELIEKWKIWKKLLTRLNQSKNISKRRASLVLLCKPLRQSIEKKVFDLVIDNVERVKGEKNILITKAVSWVLRSAIKNYKKEVSYYLEKNKTTLPKIAVRETSRKLLTGRK